jgi:cbb3-type cytochrome oxidase subunit 3
MIAGVFIAMMLLMFAGTFGWAWSSRRRPDFSEAAALALETETPSVDRSEHP